MPILAVDQQDLGVAMKELIRKLMYPSATVLTSAQQGRVDSMTQQTASAMRATLNEAAKPGSYFVVIDKSSGRAVSEIFSGAKKADAELARLEKADRAAKLQVMDAMYHNPSRAKLKAQGVVAEAVLSEADDAKLRAAAKKMAEKTGGSEEAFFENMKKFTASKKKAD